MNERLKQLSDTFHSYATKLFLMSYKEHLNHKDIHTLRELEEYLDEEALLRLQLLIEDINLAPDLTDIPSVEDALIAAERLRQTEPDPIQDGDRRWAAETQRSALEAVREKGTYHSPVHVLPKKEHREAFNTLFKPLWEDEGFTVEWAPNGGRGQQLLIYPSSSEEMIP